MQSFPCLLSSNLQVYFLLFQKTYPKIEISHICFYQRFVHTDGITCSYIFLFFLFHFERHALKTEKKIEFAKVNVPNTNFQKCPIQF